MFKSFRWPTTAEEIHARKRLAVWIALAGPPLIAFVRFLIHPWAQERLSYVLFTIPVAAAALLGGFRPGFLATVLGLFLATYLFVPPEFSWSIRDLSGTLVLVSFAATWLIISGVGEAVALRNEALLGARTLQEKTQGELSRMFELVNDGIYTVDKNFIITHVNQSLTKLLNTDREQIVGRSLWDVFAQEPDPKVHARIREALESGVSQEMEVYDPIGDRWFRLKLFPDPNREAMLVMVQEITAAKKLVEVQEILLAEERFRRSGAELESRQKDEFVAMLSHELRTPLTTILGWGELLKKFEPVDPELQTGLQAIDRAARTQASLVDDLLDLSRIVVGQLQVNREILNFPDIVGEAVAGLTSQATHRQITIHWNQPNEPMLIVADELRCLQIVSNLLSNSLKFSLPGGNIWISVSQQGEMAELVVRDDGIGIAPAILPTIFERFRQGDSSISREHGGLGLGLAIVHQLVEAQGGTVVAESPGENKGTTMTVRFPIREGELPKEGLPNKPTPRLSLRVMVVEDDQLSRDMIVRLLGADGFSVFAYPSGREALREIETIRPDVLISDVGMAEMDGYRFIAQVRGLPDQQLAKIPAIALTAFARAGDRDRALDAGFSLHLSKPVERSRLRDAIYRVAGA